MLKENEILYAIRVFPNWILNDILYSQNRFLLNIIIYNSTCLITFEFLLLIETNPFDICFWFVIYLICISDHIKYQCEPDQVPSGCSKFKTLQFYNSQLRSIARAKLILIKRTINSGPKQCRSGSPSASLHSTSFVGELPLYGVQLEQLCVSVGPPLTIPQISVQ